jgi:hypothetical protein
MASEKIVSTPPEMIRKITVGKVCGRLDFEVIQERKQVELMDVFGILTKSKPDSSDINNYERFFGQFRATNLETGEEFYSGQCILPGVAADLLSGMLTPEGGSVEFALRIGARYDKDSATKYIYTCKPLFKPADNLLALEARVRDAVKALPAPSLKKAA